MVHQTVANKALSASMSGTVTTPKSTSELDSLADSLRSDLVSDNASVSRLLSFQVSLLEIFTHEVKKLQNVGYCDSEMAYVCYKLSQELNRYSEGFATDKTKAFSQSIKETLIKKKSGFEDIKARLHNEEDPLLSRFNKLKVAGLSNGGLASEKGPTLASSSDSLSTKSTNGSSTDSASGDSQVYPDFPEAITPSILNQLLYSHNLKVLLIDYRATKVYNHNHINFDHIVNIEPSHITSLYGPDDKNATSITDQDLESRLKMHLPQDQFERFQNRYKYDLIVIYDLQFGPRTKNIDRFQALKLSLTNEDSTLVPSKNPFKKLVDLIMYKNKYISSKLKHHPSYLIGGVFAWHQTYGEAGLRRTVENEILTRPSASLSRGSSPALTTRASFSGSGYGGTGTGSSASINGSVGPSGSNSPYLKNFGEYLSTANSTSETPVSNTFKILKPGVSSDVYYYNNGNGTTAPTSNGQSVKPDQPPSQQAPLKRTPSTKIVPSIPPKPSSALEKPRSSSVSSSSSSKKTGVDPVKFLEQYTTGLVNLGNSCYMNCVLQCLGATPQLTKFFFPNMSSSLSTSSALQSYRQHINVNNKLGSKGIMTTNFVGLLISMFNNNGKSFSPSAFKRVVGSLSPNKQYATSDQQDCIEFLNFLLDGLHEDLNQIVVSNPAEKKAILELTPEQEKTRELLPIRLASTIEWERYLKLNFSIVVDYFQGQYLSQLKCLECGQTSTSYNAFSILSLPIPEKLGSSIVSLSECLKEFTATELLDDNNKWHCPRCKKFTKSTKKISITRLPQVLILHFKRFKMTPQGYFNKLEKFVTYPVQDVLDLTSYWPEIGTSLNSNSSSDDELIGPEKEAQILSSLPVRNQVPPFRYKLYGVANHFGNLTTGHYTSYVHKESDKQKTRGWCYFDDQKVTFNCSPNQVLNKNAYCLFYQRI